MVRAFRCLGLALLMAIAGCAKDPNTLVVGDLNTFATREPAAFSKLSEADQSLLKRFQSIYKPMAASGGTSLVVDGMATTWSDVSQMTVTQTVMLSRQYFAFMAEQLAQIKATQAKAKADSERKAAEERNRTPRTVTEWPMEAKLYCREAVSATEWHRVKPGGELRDEAEYRVNVYGGNVNLVPMKDGKEDNSRHFGGHYDPAYYSYFGNWSPNGAAVANGRLALKMNHNLHRDWRDWQAQFFTTMESGPLTLAERAPVPDKPTLVEETYLFTLTGKNADGPKALTLECRMRRLNEQAQAQRDAVLQAAAEAEARRPRSPNEQLIERVEAKGGNCATIGQHLRTHMQRAEQNGDWSGFQETLGRGAEYGC